MVRVNCPILVNPVTVTGTGTEVFPITALVTLPAIVTGAACGKSASGSPKIKKQKVKNDFMGSGFTLLKSGECSRTPLFHITFTNCF
jgi:hypothetical protein